MKSRPARRIGLVTDFSPPYFGGVENHAFEFSRHFLASRKTDLRSIAVMFHGDKEGSLSLLCRIAPFLRGETGRVSLLGVDSVSDAGPLSGIVKEKGLENGVLFFNSLYWISVFERLHREFPGMAIVFRSGGNDIMQSNIEGEGKTLAERRGYVVSSLNKNASRVLANSEFSFGRFSAEGLEPELMSVIVGGVDTNRFRPPKSKEEKESANEVKEVTRESK